MTGKRLSFWRVAVRPKYVAGLLLALLAAAAFAWLGQWQLDRALTKDQTTQSVAQTVTIGGQLNPKNIFIVDGRRQNGRDVYWLVGEAIGDSTYRMTVALGQTDSLLKAEAIRFQIQNEVTTQGGHFVPLVLKPISGFWLPSEEPQKLEAEKPYLLHSVSIAQLINLYAPDQPIDTYPNFLVSNTFAKQYGLGEIDAVLHPAESINWLSAFYAAEWVLFAGFAVFLWARTVKDAVDAERLN